MNCFQHRLFEQYFCQNGNKFSIRQLYMKSKKVTMAVSPAPKQRLQLEKRATQVKSLEPKIHISNHVQFAQQNVEDDYEFLKRQRETTSFAPIHELLPNSVHFIRPHGESNPFERHSEGVNVSKTRQNHILNPQEHSNRSSQQKIKLVSINSKEKSLSRSENSSLKKQRGIKLTKTSIKGISGMYNEKDFQSRASFTNRLQHSETACIIALRNGKVLDEYQLSDFDFQLPDRTYNQVGSDSGDWNNQSGSKVNRIAPLNKNLYRDSKDIQTSQSNTRGNAITPKMMIISKSHNFLDTPAATKSIVIGKQPPANSQLKRGVQPSISSSGKQYLICSKKRTLDQLSLKESMIVGVDHYYH